MQIPAKRKKIPQKRSPASWVPPGQEVALGPYRIPDGMVYVGERLAAVNRWLGSEPALINPSLRLQGSTVPLPVFGHWLSYELLPPEERAAYLGWLAGGRRVPEAPSAFVYLFLFGLERRILHDSQLGPISNDEIRQLLAEIEGLLEVYGGHSPLRFYVVQLLVVGRLLIRDLRIDALEGLVDEGGRCHPAVLQSALAQLAAEPIPPLWGFACWNNWAQARRPTAARRCAKDFRELFLIRYREAFPDGGLRLKRSRTPLVISYHPANPGFGAPLSITLAGMPDARLDPAHLRELQRVADRVASELDLYSRWIGRGGDPASLAALALLPPELARARETPASRHLLRWLAEVLAENGFALVSWAQILELWPSDTSGRLTRGAFESFVSFLGLQGYGVEPDPRFGDPVPKEGMFLFFLPEGKAAPPRVPGPAYMEAAAILQMAAMVATAEGGLDPLHEAPLLEHIETAAHLTPAERERLHLRLLWLLAEPQGLNRVEGLIRALSEPRRRAAARFLIVLAGADGEVSPGEIRQLKRIYRLLGFDPGMLYSDIHAVAAGSFVVEKGTVRSGLDLQRVEEKLAETVQASALLGEIFGEEEPVAPAPPPTGGLDAAHAALLGELAGRACWERKDFDERAAALGLLPDGALEMLNEAAFHLCGAPLLEGGETLEIDPEVLREMLP